MHGFENSRVHVRTREARKMHFCTPKRVTMHAHLNLDLVMQKDGRVA